MKLKSVVSALALSSLALSASAYDLVVQDTVATGLNPSFFDVSIPGFSAVNGVIGTLAVTGGPANVFYTYLGKEAFNTNRFFNLAGSIATILDSAAVGTTAMQEGNGILNFNFKTLAPNGPEVFNGSATNTAPTFAIFGGGSSGYEYIIGYSDNGTENDRDFDDMVFGVTAIPEPETYALLLGGLGLVGFVARRRRPT